VTSDEPISAEEILAGEDRRYGDSEQMLVTTQRCAAASDS